jgi:hypothetical protein
VSLQRLEELRLSQGAASALTSFAIVIGIRLKVIQVAGDLSPNLLDE